MNDALSNVCSELQALQRMRAGLIKSRVMAENNRRAFVANLIGYSPGLDEKVRKAKFAEADTLIKGILAKTADHVSGRFVEAAEHGIESFRVAQKETEREMLPLAKRTPVAGWVLQPEQRGFGLLSLATVIGETGDLRLYSNPAKLWARLGCAPYTHDGVTRMGGTWKSKGGLNAAAWSEYGYSPRRRSIAYVIGENLIKQNTVRTAGAGEWSVVIESAGARPGTRKTSAGERSCATETRRSRAGRKSPRRGDTRCVTGCAVAAAGSEQAGAGDDTFVTDNGGARPGPYRARYDSAKLALAELHPGDPNYPPLRCHRHGMLLATKLLLKHLWKQWNPALDRGEWVAVEAELATV